MMIKLSRRLSIIAELVPENSVLADIGSDHGLLPVFLVQSGKIRRAIAGELNTGPFEAARQQVRKAGLEDRITVRRGDGLRVLARGEVDTVTIAGMGGSLIVDILANDVNGILPDVRTLILQPNVGEDTVRSWLIDHDFILVEERILKEDGVIYEILKAVHSSQTNLTNEEVYREKRLTSGSVISRENLIRFGPFLLDQLDPAFIEKWQEEQAKLENIRRQIASQSDSPQGKRRLREIEEQIGMIEEVLQAVQ